MLFSGPLPLGTLTSPSASLARFKRLSPSASEDVTIGGLDQAWFLGFFFGLADGDVGVPGLVVIRV